MESSSRCWTTGGMTPTEMAVLSSLMRCNKNADDLFPHRVSISRTGALPCPSLQPHWSPVSAQSSHWVLRNKDKAPRVDSSTPPPTAWFPAHLGGEAPVVWRTGILSSSEPGKGHLLCLGREAWLRKISKNRIAPEGEAEAWKQLNPFFLPPCNSGSDCGTHTDV